MVKIDEKVLLKYIENNYENPTNSVEDLVLMMMGLSHLENTGDLLVGVNIALTGTATIIGMIATAPVLIAGSITAGIAGCIGIAKQGIKAAKVKSLQNRIADMLIKKYTSFIEAYTEIANMIVNVSRDDLLKFFEKRTKPTSLISYCDLSKFNGEVYSKIGFELKEQTQPAIHWYSPKTKRHITDNLLRQRGFDQLHGTNYGKGTSNEELMEKEGYFKIPDCGQLVFVKRY